ncbi:MAG: DUF459 domain-containing protein [Candidatus Gracilibacteria bacterium]
MVFILIVIIVPFCESKKIIIWQAQEESQGYNIFSNIVLQYAILSEEIKKESGIDVLFNEEYSFWAKIKESAIIFQSKQVFEEEKTQIDRQQAKILADIIKNDPIFILVSNFWLDLQEENKKAQQKQFKDLVIVLSDEIKKQTGLDFSSFVETKLAPEIAFHANNVQASPVHQTVQDNSNAVRYLIVGDSFMAAGGGLGDVVEKTVLNYGNTIVNRSGVVSSGLSRPDYFDWNAEIRKLISKYQPDKIIVMFGANDNQNLTGKQGGFVAKYGTQEWQAEYARRVDDILDVSKENNATVFWVGLPIMRTKWFSDEIADINLIYEGECQKYSNAYFVSTWKTLANDNGDYVAYLKDQKGQNELVRIKDGIHLTYYGGALVTNEIFKKIGETLN